MFPQFCKWIKTQRLKIMFINCQPVLCVPSPWILEFTFQCIYNSASKMRNCLKFSFKWWLVIIEWRIQQELWGRDSVQLSAFLSATFLCPWSLSLLIPSLLQYVRQFPETVHVPLQLSVTSALHFPSPFSSLLYTLALCFVMFSLFSKDSAIKGIFPKKGQLSVSTSVFYLKGTMKHHYLPPQRSWRNSQATYRRGLKTWFQLTLIKPLLKRFVMRIILLLHGRRI